MKLTLKTIAFIYLVIVSAYSQYNPQIQSFKNGWNQWGAQISSMCFESHVTGVVARTVLTINFKDVNSDINADSMEVNFNFNLPANSVVDSMYLWINGKPQNAALKERWSAVSAYWQVVGRRWDPALLTKWNGDAYNLRVFPFSHGQERTVRICYSTPLTATDGKLCIPYPLDIASGSALPLNSLYGKIFVEKTVNGITVSAQDNVGITSITDSTASMTTVTFSSENIIPLKQLKIFIDDKKLQETGMCSYLTKKEGSDISFMTILEPKIITGAVNTRPKNVLVIWNMISENTYRNYSYYDNNGQHHYDDSITTYLNYNYYEYQINYILKGLKAFISNQMQQGDKFNLILNDGTIKSLYQKQSGWTSETQSDLEDFIQNKVSKTSNSVNCLKPIDFLKSSVNTISNEDPLDLILVDQTYSYNYNIDTSKIDAEANAILGKLPANTTVFGLIGYNWNNPVARIQNILIQQKHGMAFYSWGDATEIFGSIGRSLTPKIYPASVSFVCDSESFTYDVSGPVDDQIYYGIPIVYTGKIRGSAQSLTIHFTYDLNKNVYQKQCTFPVNVSTTVSDPVEKIWAASRVNKLLYNRSSYAYNEYSEALNLSLKYRILTDKTALIAFEPGLMAESWYKDDLPREDIIGGNALPVQQQKRTPVQPIIQMTIQHGYLKISIEGIKIPSKYKSASVKLYNLKGQLIADLSSKISWTEKVLNVQLKTASLASGKYIIRFVLGKTVLQKTITIK